MKQTLIILILLFLFAISGVAQIKSQQPKAIPQAQKFIEIEWICNTQLSMDIARFAKALKKNPTNKAYIIVYVRSLIVGDFTTNEMFRNVNLYLQKNKIPLKRVIEVEGGFRGHPTFELFILPKGALPPAPTPIQTNVNKREDKPQVGERIN